MRKTLKDYDEYIKKLEVYARENPESYKMRVLLLALLGYIYIFSVLLVLILLIIGFVLIIIFSHHLNALLIKFGIVFAIIIFVIIRSLWVNFHEPVGYEIKSKDAPPLFETIEELRKIFKAPKIHKVILDYGFNAGIMQVPRLGFLGFPKNYLLIGLPYMQAMSPEQFKGTLAHELAHISQTHGVINSRIYMIRETWHQMMNEMAKQSGFGLFLFRAFLNWYYPFFDAYSFILSRNHEYEADLLAAEIVGPKVKGDGLISAYVKMYFLEEDFWANLYLGANHNPTPSDTAISELLEALKKDIEPEKFNKWLDIELKRKSNFIDVHPSLSDRLSALKYKFEGVEKFNTTAAEVLLGENLLTLTKSMDQQWLQANKSYWENNYKYVQEEKAKLKVLEEKAAKEDITIEEAWEFATKTEYIYGKDEALKFYQIVLEYDPEHAGANYATGTILLSKDTPDAVNFLTQAMKDYRYASYSCDLLYNYYTRLNKEEQAKFYYEKYLNQLDTLRFAEEERSQSILAAKLKPHNMPEKDISGLIEHLKKYPEVKKVFIAERELQYIPENHFYVIGLIIKWPWHKTLSDHNKISYDLIYKIASEYQFSKDIKGEVLYYLLNDHYGEFKKLENNMKKLESSLIYLKK